MINNAGILYYYNLNVYGDRNQVRMSVVNQLSKEEPGKGKGILASRYTYYVEKLSDGNRIYLRRPANLHNGFDFVVAIENYNFNQGGRKCNYPKHDDIINDLKSKCNENRVEYIKLFSILEKVHDCIFVSEEDMKFYFKTGYSSDMVIKTLKWLFIEQDIRYWNYSGRDMLWNAIVNI